MLSLDICCSLRCFLLVLLHFKKLLCSFIYFVSWCLCTQATVCLWKSEDKMQESVLPFGMWGPEIWFESPGLVASAFLTESSHWLLSESNTLGLLESSILTFNFSTSSHFQHHTGLSWWLPLALAHRFPFAPQVHDFHAFGANLSPVWSGSARINSLLSTKPHRDLLHSPVGSIII